MLKAEHQRCHDSSSSTGQWTARQPLLSVQSPSCLFQQGSAPDMTPSEGPRCRACSNARSLWGAPPPSKAINRLSWFAQGINWEGWWFQPWAQKKPTEKLQIRHKIWPQALEKTLVRINRCAVHHLTESTGVNETVEASCHPSHGELSHSNKDVGIHGSPSPTHLASCLWSGFGSKKTG